MKILMSLVCLAVLGFSQANVTPPQQAMPSEMIKNHAEHLAAQIIARRVRGDFRSDDAAWVASELELLQRVAIEEYERRRTAVLDKTCTSTTLDGLPNCPMPTMSSTQCLKVAPPDQVGGYCEWYGYSTKQQADAFEKKRGYFRVKHANGTGDTWQPDRRTR